MTTDLQETGSPGVEKIRAAIIEVDTVLVELMHRRATLGQSTAKGKRGCLAGTVFPGQDPHSERLARLGFLEPQPPSTKQLTAVCHEILASPSGTRVADRVAYAGPQEGMHHLAGLALFGATGTFRPQPSLEEVFRAVAEGKADFGVATVHNPPGGIGEGMALLLQNPDLHIRGETSIGLQPSLLSREKDLRSVTRVFCPPAALTACRAWLDRYLPHAAVTTVSGTEEALGNAEGIPGCAVIASSALAPSCRLRTLARNLDGNSPNETRFIIFGPSPVSVATDRTILAFTLPEQSGTLCGMLRLFADRRITVASIEVRTLPGESGTVVFFAELACDIRSSTLEGFLDEARARCLRLRVLGAFPSRS